MDPKRKPRLLEKFCLRTASKQQKTGLIEGDGFEQVISFIHLY